MYIRRRIMVALVASLFFYLVVKDVSQETPAKCDGALHIVTSGETIWSVAQQHCTDGVMTAIRQLVDEYGVIIMPGDRLQLP